MPDASVEAAIAHWSPRFVTQGVDPNDFKTVTSGLERWEEWLDAWCANGDMHAGLAREAEEAGRALSAGRAWVRAALGYHFAKFVWVLDPERHRQATEQSVASLRCAHRLLDPTAERIEVPFEGASLVGNLRRPPSVQRPALVLLVPGLDSTKEEFFHWEQVFLDRQMATLSMDGPGQGETGFSLPIRHDYEVPVAAMLDHLGDRRDLDLDRIGAVGVSLGGYYAPRAATFEDRIKAVVSVGGTYAMGPRFDTRPTISRQALMYYMHTTSEDEARERSMQMSLEGVIDKLRQPLLVIFGKLDRLVPWQEGERTASEAQNGKLVLYPEGNHVCNNLPYLYRPLAADWIGEQLR
ncbi:MAG: alpha/beta hydrolase family protein [Acidimicrobiales bacterium]